MKRLIFTTLMAASAGLLASCAMGEQQSAQAVPPTGAVPTTGQACFSPRDVRNWREEGALSVLLHVRRGDIYRARLLAPCFDLNSASRIVLEPRGGVFVCELDEAVIYVPGGANGPSRCLIDRVHKLTGDEVSAIPKNQRP